MPTKPRMLEVKAIGFADRVMQPRMTDQNVLASKQQVETLMEAIRNAEGHLIEAVVIWWSGKRWICIDGHHRLIAYQHLAKAEKKPLVVEKVRVEVFEGDLNAAIARAVELNSRAKLPMLRHERIERAWKLVAMADPALSIKQTSIITGVSIAQVKIMRAKREDMQAAINRDEEAHADDPLQVGPKWPLEMTWKEALAIGKPHQVVDEDWLEKLARGHALRIFKACGSKLASNPSVAAMALEYYSAALPPALVEEWRDLDEDSDIDDDCEV